MNIKETFKPLYSVQPFLLKMMKTVEGIKAYKDLIQEAENEVNSHIATLELQTQREVVPAFNCGDYDCPECESRSLYRLWKFCPQCGAKLNWEETKV